MTYLAVDAATAGRKRRKCILDWGCMFCVSKAASNIARHLTEVALAFIKHCSHEALRDIQLLRGQMCGY